MSKQEKVDNNDSLDEKLKLIVPGKTYPESVTVTDPKPGGDTLVFQLRSYIVGMYMSIRCGEQIDQNTDSTNRKLVKTLLGVIKTARKDGHNVEIGNILPVATK